MDQNNQDQKVCKCPHHKVGPIVVILFAIAFLLGDFGTISWQVFNITWPILLIIAAASKMCGCGCKCCSKKM